MEYHPAANLFPMMTDEEFSRLKDDIYEFGQRDPIIVYDGKILDGRNRYRACIEMEIEPSFLKLDSHDVGKDPIAYVWSVNARRRHLTDSQLAIAAGNVEKLYMEDAHARMVAGKATEPCGTDATGSKKREPTSRQKAAKALGISDGTAAKGSRVLKAGAKELIEAVNAGTVNITTADKLAKVVPDKDEQAAIVAEAATKDNPNKELRAKISEKTPARTEPEKTPVSTADQPAPKTPISEGESQESPEKHAVSNGAQVPTTGGTIVARLEEHVAEQTPAFRANGKSSLQAAAAGLESPPAIELSKAGRRKLTTALDKLIGLMEGEGIADTFRTCLVSMSEAIVSSFEATEPQAGHEKFEAWWTTYPKKVGKDAALRAYLAAVKRLKDKRPAAHTYLVERATAFAASPKAKGSFCPNPATWLNEGRYDDDPATWNDAGGKTNGRQPVIGPGQRNTTGDASRAGVGKW